MDDVRDIENYIQPNKPDWKNTRIIFVTGIIAFIASLLANLLSNNTQPIFVKAAIGVFSFLALFAIVAFLVLFYRGSRYYREEKLSKEKVCAVVNNQMTASLKKMLQVYDSKNNQEDIIKHECLYKIDIILEFLERNVYKEYIRYNSESVYLGRAYSRIAPGTMKSIFSGIHIILSSLKTDEDNDVKKYCVELLSKNAELCKNLLNIDLS